MKEQQINHVIETISNSSRRRFAMTIGVAITLSAILVVVSMFLYSSSGAAQLDLSRPGYVNVRSQAISNSNSMQTYSDTGAINQESIDEFKQLFEEQKDKIDSVDAFGSAPLSDEALGIAEN